jgi:uncharacterized protein (TIGR02186 family)
MIPAAALPVSVAVAPAPNSAAISAALTDTQVEVTSGYHGARIVLYGAVFNPSTRPTDVVVVVRGPERPIRLVRKIRVAGVWLNSRPVVFEGAPGFYMTASSRPLPEIAGFGVLRRAGIGVDHLRIEAPEESHTVTRYGIRDVVVSRLGADYLDWRRAVIRLMEKGDLYKADTKGVRYVDRNLFRADVDLPTEAPTGRYETEVWLFQDGRPVSVKVRPLTVAKVGIERRVYNFAHVSPWLYGLVCVALALASGWIASVLFRRS